MTSEKPWSDYSTSDYSVEQWHAACLIHLHEGAPTSKSQCKVPVKTPGGAVNRNGVHAAAAALAGARGGVNAPAEDISKAKRAIVRLYSQLGESPPESMSQSATEAAGEDFIEHFGVKGMKWGVRNEARRESRDARRDSRWEAKRRKANPSLGRMHGKVIQKIINDATKAMKPEIKALNNRPEYTSREAKRILRSERGSYKGVHPLAVRYKKDVSDIYMRNVRNVAGKHLEVSPSGKWQESLVIGKDHWSIQLKRVEPAERLDHANISDPDLSIRVRPVMDEDGYIIDFEIVDDELAQDGLDVDEFLEHFGVKGMKWGVRKRRNEAARARTFGGKSKRKSNSQTVSLKDLSDHELRTIVNRMNMEQQYMRLSRPQDKPSVLKKVLAAGTTVNAAIAFSRSPAGRAITSALIQTTTNAFPTSRAVGSIGKTEIGMRPLLRRQL